MADYDLDELRALRRRATEAIAKAEAAIGDLRSIEAVTASLVNRLLDTAVAAEVPMTRERIGDRQKEIFRTIRKSGGGKGKGWFSFALITGEFPNVSERDLKRSLDAGRGTLWEQQGDQYQLLRDELS